MTSIDVSESLSLIVSETINDQSYAWLPITPQGGTMVHVGIGAYQTCGYAEFS